MLKRPRRGVDHPFLLTDEVKNEWSHTSTLPPLSLYGMLQNDFYLYTTLYINIHYGNSLLPSFVRSFVCLFLSFFLSFFHSYFYLFLPAHCRRIVTVTTLHIQRHTHTLRGIGPSHRPLPENTQLSEGTDIHAPSGIRACNTSKRKVSREFITGYFGLLWLLIIKTKKKSMNKTIPNTKTILFHAIKGHRD